MGTSPKGTNICEDSNFMEFHQGKIFFSDVFVENSKQYTTEITKIAKENSILLCIRAPVGEVNLTNREICIGRGLAAIKPFVIINELFVFYWLKAFKDSLVKKATGTTFIAVTSDIVRELLLPLPPIEEQCRILNTIQNTVNILSLIEKSLN